MKRGTERFLTWMELSTRLTGTVTVRLMPTGKSTDGSRLSYGSEPSLIEEGMPQKICMFVTNRVTGDPRVQREARTLVKGGYQVVVIGVRGEEESREEWLDGYKIIRITYPVLVCVRQEFINMRLALLAMLKRFFPDTYDALRMLYRRYRPRVEVFGPTEQAAKRVGLSARVSFRTRLQTDQMNIRTIFWLNQAMFSVGVRQNADIYHAHDLDTLLAGYLAKLWTGKKLVYDFHELYTEQFKEGIKTFLWRVYFCVLERILVKRADLKLTVCDSIGEWVTRKYRVSPAITVMNVPVCENSLPLQRIESKDKVILYHGGYISDRGLEHLIESARHLEQGRIVLRGYGYLEDQLRELVKEKGVEDKVLFALPVPMTELVRTASEASIGVIPYLPVCLNNRFCLPNKLFEYMMAGLAIAGSDGPELRRIILEHNLGTVFNPEEPKDIARAFNELLADESGLEKMRSNSLFASRTIFNWDNEGQKLLRLYDSALGLFRT